MAGNVSFNGRSAVHAGSGGQLQTEDVCKVKKKTCTSTLFKNLAVSKDAAATAGTVFVNGHPLCTAKSNFAKSTGDEPGRCGGTQSGTTQQRAEFVSFSGDVFAEGQPVVRQGDQMVSNLRNTPPAPLMQPPAGEPPTLAAQEAVAADPAEAPFETGWDICGAEVGLLKGHAELSEDKTS